MVEINGILATVSKFELQLLDTVNKKEECLDKKNQILISLEENKNAVEKIKKLKMETQKSVDNLNLSVAEYDEKLKELNSKMNYILFGGGKNADLEIIKKQIGAAKADRSVLEDEMIVMWGKIEKVEKDIKEATKSLELLKTDITRKTDEIDTAVMKLNEDIGVLNTKISENIEKLNPDNAELHAMYMRLQQKEVTPSAVTVRDGICQGCFLDLPPDVVNKIMDGSPGKCPNCYRILCYNEEENDQEMSDAESE